VNAGRTSIIIRGAAGHDRGETQLTFEAKTHLAQAGTSGTVRRSRLRMNGGTRTLIHYFNRSDEDVVRRPPMADFHHAIRRGGRCP
jgi:hypothetical protein